MRSGQPGCFYGKSTAKIILNLPDALTNENPTYRIKVLKRFGKAIPDANLRKRFYDKLDLLLSEIRSSFDPGSEIVSQAEVSERTGSRRGSAKGRAGRTSGPIKDEDTTLQTKDDAKFSPKFKPMGQLELPLKGHQFELGFDEENFIKVEAENGHATQAGKTQSQT